MSTFFINRFLKTADEASSAQLIHPSNVIERHNVHVNDGFLTLMNRFLRIYYSSAAFDLGKSPNFSEKNNSYNFESIMYQIDAALKTKSFEMRPEAIHDAWAHNYIYWASNNITNGFDHKLVSFRDLPVIDRQKYHFIAELVTLLHVSNDLNVAQENQIADLCIQNAVYHVAFEILRDINSDIPTANEIFETNLNVGHGDSGYPF